MPAGPPEFVTESETAWNTTTSPKTASVTVQAGDWLVICGGAEDIGSPNLSLGTPTGGSLTYTPQRSLVQASSCPTYLWTAPATSSQTFNVSITRSGDTSRHWGYNVLQFRSAQGIGATAISASPGSGAPTMNITTQQDNSALAVFNTDWAAQDGTSRTWRTPSGCAAITEQTYQKDGTAFASYLGWHPSTGAAGVKAVGLSAPGSQTYILAACEVLGWAKPPILVANIAAVGRAGSW